MEYRLEKLVVHNFKLFSHVEIDIGENNLVMLDGANGYGKTSIFDALEYLFTGDVKRISENKVFKTTISFEEDCLIKVPSDGTQTYVEGIFEGDKTVKIIRKLMEGKGAENNPSKIQFRTKTTLVCDGKTVCQDETVENANKRIICYLGKAALDYYSQFYYVSQEGRLQFLSKSEIDRNNELKKLFGIEKEEENYKKIEKAITAFRNLKNKYSGEVESKKQEVKKLKEEIKGIDSELHVEYKDLITDEELCPVWNQKRPKIESKEKLLEITERVRAAGVFSREIEWFKEDEKNVWIEEQVKKREALKKYLYLNGHSEELNFLKMDIQQYYKLLEILESAEQDDGGIDYEKYDYKKLKEILNLKLDLEEVAKIKNEIEKSRKNVKEEDAARDKMMSLQEKIKKEWESWQDNDYEGLADNQCPLCGQPYEDKQALIQTLDVCRMALDSGQKDSQKLVKQEIEKLKELYDAQCKVPIEEYLKAKECYEDSICRELYENWDEVLRGYRSFLVKSREYDFSEVFIIAEENFDESDEITEEFIIWLEEQKSELLNEYYTNKEKYRYKEVLTLDYKNQIDKVRIITEEEENSKIRYIEQEYYGGRQKELETKEKEEKILEERMEKITIVEDKLKGLRDKVREKMNNYKSELVNQLRLPFYLYTGRILQNYPGGLGIWLREKDGKIHFEAGRRKQHDVLYTLSSGQLSAVAIAIALTLNKTYAQQSMKCMFIDDPIQTMDELNIASFVEVLRTDFTEYQFILSTHEENFSDYIRYKFDRGGLTNVSITVQNLGR